MMSILEYIFPLFRHAEVMRASDRCRNEQGKIEADIKDFEVKASDLVKQKGEIEKKAYNVEACKRNLQRHIKATEALQANVIGK